jgi:hypothetical protein
VAAELRKLLLELSSPAADALLAGVDSPDADHDERFSAEDFPLDGGYDEDFFVHEVCSLL